MKNIDKKKFGSFIAELRKENNMTQSELAKKLNISAKAISKWETGVSLPDINLLMPLAEQLGISTAELLQSQRNITPVKPVEVDEIIQKTITISKFHYSNQIKRILQPVGLILAFVLLYLMQFLLFPYLFPAAFPKSLLAFMLLISSYAVVIFAGMNWISVSMLHWLAGVSVYAFLILQYSANGAYCIIPVLDSSQHNFMTIYYMKEFNKVTPLLIGVLILGVVFFLKHYKEIKQTFSYPHEDKKNMISISPKIFLLKWNIVVFAVFGYCALHQINLLFYLWIGVALIGGFFLITDGYSARTVELKRGFVIDNEMVQQDYDLKQRRKAANGSSFSNTLAYMTVPLLICIAITIIFF